MQNNRELCIQCGTGMVVLTVLGAVLDVQEHPEFGIH